MFVLQTVQLLADSQKRPNGYTEYVVRTSNMLNIRAVRVNVQYVVTRASLIVSVSTESRMSFNMRDSLEQTLVSRDQLCVGQAASRSRALGQASL